MKSKILKGAIVLALLVVYFVIIGIKNVKGANADNAKILKEVTVVADGKVNPQNNGKLVLVTGKVNFEKGIQFDELAEPINSFKVVRTVKDFVESKDEKGEKHWDWIDRTEPKSYFGIGAGLDSLCSKEVTVPVKIGEYVLDQKGVSLAPVRGHYSKAESIFGLKWNGRDYGSNHDDDVPGDVSVSYDYYDVAKYPDISVLAMQSGESFVPYTLGKTEVYKFYTSKIDSVDALKAVLADEVKSNKKSRIIFIVIILAVGVWLILSSSKPSKNKKADDNTAEAKTDSEEKTVQDDAGENQATGDEAVIDEKLNEPQKTEDSQENDDEEFESYEE